MAKIQTYPIKNTFAANDRSIIIDSEDGDKVKTILKSTMKGDKWDTWEKWDQWNDWVVAIWQWDYIANYFTATAGQTVFALDFTYNTATARVLVIKNGCEWV